MDFHALTPMGEVHILSTDGSGKILTPLPDSPPSAPQAGPVPAAQAPPARR